MGFKYTEEEKEAEEEEEEVGHRAERESIHGKESIGDGEGEGEGGSVIGVR